MPSPFLHTERLPGLFPALRLAENVVKIKCLSWATIAVSDRTEDAQITMNRRAQTVAAFIAFLVCWSAIPAYSLDYHFTFLFAVSRLIDGTSLRDPRGLDVSKSSGDIIIADTGNNQVRIFDKNGVLIKSIGQLAAIRSPYDVAFGKDEDMYVTEMGSSKVKRLDVTGSLLPPIVPEIVGSQLALLGRICVDYKDTVYVADRDNPRILIMSEADNQIRQIAQTPREGEPEWKVQDIAVDAARNVYILSSQGQVVHVFNHNGTHVRSFGNHGAKDEEFSYPTAVAIGPDGNLWIVDSFKQEIKVFSPDGYFRFRWGETGMGDGQLFYPIDIAFGASTLYVLEKGSSRLQAFSMASETVP